MIYAVLTNTKDPANKEILLRTLNFIKLPDAFERMLTGSSIFFKLFFPVIVE